MMRKKLTASLSVFLGLMIFSGCSMFNGIFMSNSNSSDIDSTSEKVSSREDVNGTEENVALTITSPRGMVYPYIPTVKRYIEAGEDADVSTYGGAENQYRAVKIAWECDASNVSEYAVEYATKADYSDAIRETSNSTSIELFNLYKATTYYVRVTAYDGNGKVIAQEESTFETTDLGPRFMKIDGIYNVRDLGGYKTSDGKTTVQGMLYRGGSLTPADVYPHNLTDRGKAYMSDVLGIKTEIDFRSPTETGGYMESAIPGAKLSYVTLGGYSDAFTTYASAYKEAFSMLADKDNYPIYMHCTGGADRTGTVSFLLNALLGVSELECVQDYELTTFSIYNARNTKHGAYAGYYQEFREKLDAFDGDTLQEKVENYLLSIGVTAAELDNIKAIMYGEK